MAEQIRVYKTEVQDALRTKADVAAAISSGLPPETFESQATLPESRITIFCDGCDFLQAKDNLVSQLEQMTKQDMLQENGVDGRGSMA